MRGILTDMNRNASWPGYFISLEGLDGAGKSTQVASLGAALHSDGYEVTVVRPYDTEMGELCRNFVLSHHKGVVNPWSELFLFFAGWVQLLDEIIMPALFRGNVVIADRYIDSTIAYQGGGRGVSVDLLRQLYKEACRDVWPELTLFLRLPREVAVARQRTQQLPLDRIERAPDSFHAAVEAHFEKAVKDEPQRVVPINAAQSAVQISRDISAVVRARLEEAHIARRTATAASGHREKQ